MIELTKDQHQALLENGAKSIRAIDPESGMEYVLIPAKT